MTRTRLILIIGAISATPGVIYILHALTMHTSGDETKADTWVPFTLLFYGIPWLITVTIITAILAFISALAHHPTNPDTQQPTHNPNHKENR